MSTSSVAEGSETEVSVSTSLSEPQKVMGASTVGEIALTVVEARNLPNKSYHCMVRLRNQLVDKEAMKTGVAPKGTAPRWNQTFTFPVTEIDNEVRVMIYNKKKLYSLGEVIVPLTTFKNLDTTESEKWYKIIKTASDIDRSGEIFLSATYRPSGDSGDVIKETDRRMKSNLLRSLQSGPTTTFEQMENAVLEEHGFLSTELRRLTRIQGKKTTSETVQNLLEVLERRAEELKLKRSADIQGEEISECLSQIRKVASSSTDSTSEVKSITEIEDDLVVVSSEMSSIISNLKSKQANAQSDSLTMLDDRLVTDSEKRSFAHGGGVSALLSLLTSSDTNIVHKALEVLHRATYFESGRAHRELAPLTIAKVVTNFAKSTNKDHSVYASCIITNLLHLKDSNMYKYFAEKDGLQDILSFLKSDNAFLQLRTLWGLSSMPAGDKTTLFQHIWKPVLRFLGDSSNPEHQAKACAVISNFAYDVPTLEALDEEAEDLIPALVSVLKAADERSLEALRAVANLSSLPTLRSQLNGAGCIEAVIPLLKQKELITQSAWTLANLSLDDSSMPAICKSGAIENLLQELPSCSTDAKEKTLWALCNLSRNEQARDIISSSKGALEALIGQLESKSEKILSPTIDILFTLSVNPKVAERQGQLKVPQKYCQLLLETNQPATKEKLCWATVRLAANCTDNQDHFQKAGALVKLGEMIEEGSTYQKAALWALYYLTVNNKNNMNLIKEIDVLQSLVTCLQNESMREIARKFLSLFLDDETEKRRIIDAVARDVRTRKISFSNE